MAQFTFLARDSAGRDRRGALEAASQHAALEDLRSRGLVALDVTPARDTAGAAPGAKRRAGPGLLAPRSVDVEISLQQLALMLRSGLPLLAAIRTCAEQATRRSLQRAWTQVAERIQEGWSLSDALAEHAFMPPIVVTMVRVGEQTGVLDRVLVQAAGALERRRILIASVKQAMTYPAIVVLLSIGVVAYMMVGLIPKLRVFLTSFGRKLPAMTQMLVDVSDALQRWWILGLIVFACAVIGLWALRRWPPARMSMDRWVLRVPLFGTMLRLAATATFARGLSTLLASGVRLTEALLVVESLHRNRHVARRVALARERVFQGATLAEPLAEGRAFMPLLASMVAVGEQSGTLEEVLAEVAAFHEARLEALIRRLSSLLEPFVLLFVGGLVGFIYISVFMAIYAIAGNR